MPSPVPDADPAPTDAGITDFARLNLSPAVQRVLADVGYETPSPIQAAAIPPLLEGRDMLGQAQTGTGKTAAFALPILSRLDGAAGAPQALVLAPTRELAIQVAEAFQTYATHIPGFRVLPIYGGQGYGPQLKALRQGVHVVVGTPGRVIDHINKGKLDLSALRHVVLDEADEMLRMGFAEDVDTILAATPGTQQTALFSATMPKAIRRIAHAHLDNPAEVAIAAKTATAEHIRQRYWKVSGVHKLDALTRILEAEPIDAMLVFARTRQSTEVLREKLGARGFNAAAINGDIAQNQRERLIKQLRDGSLDILVATDVAARGLDVERISHVINYDIPHDTESYVHRIGRTGRAGRAGEAILFVSPRERGMLHAIERATRQKIEPMQLPAAATVNDRRVERFLGRIETTLTTEEDLTPFRDMVERFAREHDTPVVEIAAALARMSHGKQPFLLNETQDQPANPAFKDKPGKDKPASPKRERGHQGETGKTTFRLDVGHTHGAQPKNIIGAIANEGGIDSDYIGRLSIRERFSLIDLPDDLPNNVLHELKKTRVAGRPLDIHPDTGGPGKSKADKPHHKPGKSAKKHKGKKNKNAGKHKSSRQKH